VESVACLINRGRISVMMGLGVALGEEYRQSFVMILVFDYAARKPSHVLACCICSCA
jgi:hypothetical protein